MDRAQCVQWLPTMVSGHMSEGELLPSEMWLYCIQDVYKVFSNHCPPDLAPPPKEPATIQKQSCLPYFKPGIYGEK